MIILMYGQLPLLARPAVASTWGGGPANDESVMGKGLGDAYYGAPLTHSLAYLGGIGDSDYGTRSQANKSYGNVEYGVVRNGGDFTCGWGCGDYGAGTEEGLGMGMGALIC